MRSANHSVHLSIPHRTIRLALLLLPVWILGAGELVQFAWKNSITGPIERTGLVKGRDFVQFYVAGSLAREGRWRDLYDVTALKRAVAERIPAAAGIIPAPVYPPQVAAFFAPWTQLPYLTARWLWFVVCSIAYLVGAGILIHLTIPPEYRQLAWVTTVCNPLLAMTLTTGQLSALAVLMWVFAAVALANGYAAIGGVCLGLLAYKPSLLVGVVLVLLVTRTWSVLVGVLISVAVQICATFVASGSQPWWHFVRSIATLPQYYYLTDTLPYQKQSLLGFFQLLTASGTLAFLLAMASAIAVLCSWLKLPASTAGHWYTPLLAASSVLLSPHLYVYDLAVLTPGLILAAAALSGAAPSRVKGAIAWSGYALLYAPYSGAMAMHLGIQLSTITLAVFFVAVRAQWLSETAGNIEVQ